MTDIAIEIHGLGKQFRIGAEKQRYVALRDTIANAVQAPFRRIRRVITRSDTQPAHRRHEHFWALRDVSMQIKQGEVVGIIGRNGAGKSTLLKILSRITEPTEGYAELRGRVGTLLEVGTGFHPELTGRENIYMNGAVLGMRRHEINRQFDEIVAFADVEAFIDTPVKHYSSGMALRLGFSVAAHLEPEILIVDEVLAVGDQAFQNKCLGKMGDVARSGRTVLLVSHNMAAITNLCTQTALLHHGQLLNVGPTNEVVEAYMLMTTQADELDTMLASSRHIESIRVQDADLRPIQSVPLGCPFVIEVTMKDLDQLPTPNLGLLICNHFGDRLILLANHIQSKLVLPKEKRVVLRIALEPLTLLPGYYTFEIGVGTGFEVVERLKSLPGFTVEHSDYFETGKLPNAKQGVIAHRAAWEVVR